MKKHTLGIIAEYIVIVIYKLKLYQILYHRLRNYSGEIDIIALRGKQLVFIEVKARKNIYFDDQIVSEKQKMRIVRAAEVFVSRRPKYKGYRTRFDLVILRPYKWPKIMSLL